MYRKISLCLAFSCIVASAFSQKIKFGSVEADDFKPTAYALDSSASSIVIADIGSTEIIGNSKGAFSLLYKSFRRARIINKNGYDLAEVSIPLYKDGSAEEQLENLKAVTYNLENGKVIETKLDTRSGVFKDEMSKNLVVRKFTFPNIKEGSIIEYEYKIQSDFIFNLQPWSFQGEYPTIWSEYKVSIPEFYSYVTLAQGYHPFTIKDQKSRTDNFQVSDSRGTGATERAGFTANVTDYRWVMRDVPALKEEGFTSTIRNHVSRIEFQMAAVKDPFVPRTIMDNWPNVSRRLMESEDFGQQLTKDNGWLGDITKEAIGNATTSTEKAKNIFTWVRENFTCTNYNRRSMDQNLRNVLKNKSGNEAEINLLMTAMLRKAGVQAHPVLLSTRSHGYVHNIYPLMDRFNYVISRVVADEKEYYLDAAEPRMGFGRLKSECYNGAARVIDENATPIELNPEAIIESKITAIFMINEGGKIAGTLNQVPGYYESHQLRETMKSDGKTKMISGFEKSMGNDITISNARFDSLDKYDHPVGITYDFSVPLNGEDVIYFNPMMGEGLKENPFKSALRYYPVEMPFRMDDMYSVEIPVPEGYVLDELPKQAIVKFNEEGDALFEYRISANANTISLRSRLQVKRAYFDPEEYEILRNFFDYIVKKHSEQIVFKKKK